MQATLSDPAKFDRLAARLRATSSEAKGRLRKRFEGEAAKVNEYRTRVMVTPTPLGAVTHGCHRP